MYLPTGKVWDFLLSFMHSCTRLKYVPIFWSPRTLNEYFLREKLKFSINKTLANSITDKAMLKSWLEKIGFPDLPPKNYLIANSANELEGIVLPKKCVIKPTHSSGKVLIINEKTPRSLSKKELLKIDSWLKENYFLRGREPNYKNITPRIIIEEFLAGKDPDQVPNDYKIFCADGVPFLIQLDLDRFNGHTRQLYSTEWNLLSFSYLYDRDPTPHPKPLNLQKALEIAVNISKNFKLCRIDMYLLNDNTIKVGEVTFFPENCGGRFKSFEEDLEVGKLISNILNSKQQ